ncbi:caspase recruitment domain-containing protein 9 isoform X2 [Protopterus annectens]|nr:caspase recruitment domain-containing protein 9 isoform X2 [Protopterus annectens]XP_043914658.1 caspase recruitment domain-containing protein 9 isoform X2 [Protopterus annectens]
MSDHDGDDDEECWNALDSYRVKLISVIEPCRITPYLRQCKVLNNDDEEQILNDPNLVIRKRKVGVLLDLLQRRGHRGYEAFMESLELYYPELYKRITGQEPARVFSTIIDTAGESSLMHLLMNEVTKLQHAVKAEQKRNNELKQELVAREDEIKQLKVKESELHKLQDRVRKMKDEKESVSEELKKCKEESYDLAMKYAKLSEEKNEALMRTRDLQLEIERLKHHLMKAEDDCKVERKHTIRLRHAIELRPSPEAVLETQMENDLLKARIKELETSKKVDNQAESEKEKKYIQTLEDDQRLAWEQHQELVNTIYNQRKQLRQTEELRDKYIEEKEVCELKCMTLQKDSEMYKERTEAILRQMEEVAAERDEAIRTREEFHKQYSRSLIEKDAYRKQIRELGEKCDELQIELVRKEADILSLEMKLRKLFKEPLTPTSDFDDSSPRNSQVIQNIANGDLPGHQKCRIKKKIYAAYRRRRNIMLRSTSNQGVDWENVTGSDNTDTDVS